MTPSPISTTQSSSSSDGSSSSLAAGIGGGIAAALVTLIVLVVVVLVVLFILKTRRKEAEAEVVELKQDENGVDGLDNPVYTGTYIQSHQRTYIPCFSLTTYYGQCLLPLLLQLHHIYSQEKFQGDG